MKGASQRTGREGPSRPRNGVVGRALGLAIAPAVATAVMACGSATASDDPAGPGPSGPSVTWELQAAFEACSAWSEAAGAPAVGAECASVRVPLDWGDAGGKSIAIFVKRIVGDGTGPAVWLTAGDVGASGADADGLAVSLHARDTSLDIFWLDPRGTGRSERLGCPIQEAASGPGGVAITASEWPACIAGIQDHYGPDLRHFSIDTAARDMAEIAARTRRRGQELVWFGASFGAWLTWRAAGYTPGDRIVLDAPCLPGACFSSEEDAWFADAARRLGELCAIDAKCFERMGAEPWARVAEAVERVERRQCPDERLGPLTAERFRAFARAALATPDRGVELLGVAHRLLRCSENDVNALTKWLRDLDAPRPIPIVRRLRSDVLGSRWSSGAMWRPARSVSAPSGSVVLADALSEHREEWWWSMRALWKLDTAAAEPSVLGGVPIMLFSPSLAPSPEHLWSETRELVERAEGERTMVVGATPTAWAPDPLARGAGCVRDAVLAAIRGRADWRPPCLSTEVAPNFDPSAADALRIFGQDDFWGDAQP